MGFRSCSLFRLFACVSSAFLLCCFARGATLGLVSRVAGRWDCGAASGRRRGLFRCVCGWTFMAMAGVLGAAFLLPMRFRSALAFVAGRWFVCRRGCSIYTRRRRSSRTWVSTLRWARGRVRARRRGPCSGLLRMSSRSSSGTVNVTRKCSTGATSSSR